MQHQMLSSPPSLPWSRKTHNAPLARKNRKTMKHACKRCGINFPTQQAYRVHVFESMDHHICLFCGSKQDFPTFTALQQHLEHTHLYCEPCHWFAPSSVGLRQHNLSKHNMCAACGDFFRNPHELHGHAARHRPRNVNCRCCDQLFTTLSALFNHLESGACPSDIPRDDIHGLAAEFLNSEPQYGNPAGYLFFCHACQKPFKRMCDLLQHCETGTCKEGYCLGTGRLRCLVRYILDNVPDLARNDGPEDQEGKENEAHVDVLESEDQKGTAAVAASRDIPAVIISDDS